MSVIPEFHTMGSGTLLGNREAPPAETAKESLQPYKALVLFYLNGGADSWNLLVPMDCPLWDEYNTVRGVGALTADKLLKVSTTDQTCEKFGIHHKMSFVRDLYQSQEAAFVTNVGALVEPLYMQNLKEKSLCVGLYSHADMQTAGQTLKCQVAGSSPGGFGGRVADALQADDIQATLFSIAGTNPWTTSMNLPVEVISYKHGAAKFEDYDRLRPLVDGIRGKKHESLYAEEFVQQLGEALDSSERLGAFLANVSLETEGQFRDTKISGQLYQVAKLIRTHTLRKAERDLFFVQSGGWDLHSDADGEKAAELWQEVDWAIEDFVNEMKAQNEFDNVVLATSSDFGRTLTSNGKGTDHGWAGNHLIVGGAIQGGRVFNEFPKSLLDGNDQDARRGRLVPRFPC
jgi:cullin-associated NEDD8-dissociated protein 1